MKKIFLATSFSGQTDDEGKILPEYRKFVDDILAALRQDAEVFCAAEHEDWQYYHATAEAGVKKDLDEIDKADVLLALMHSKISGGIHVEIGYAVGKNKQVILVTDHSELSYFTSGLVGAGKAEHIAYKDPESLTEEVLRLAV